MTQHADLLAINAIRTLSIDAIEKANSGHPGLPMGVQWLIRFGQNNYAIIQQIQNGLTVIVLYYQQVMAQCFYTAYFTLEAMVYQWKKFKTSANGIH